MEENEGALEKYIRESQKNGKDMGSIINDLRGAGWPEEHIQAAVSRSGGIEVKNEVPAPPPASFPNAFALFGEAWRTVIPRIGSIVGVSLLAASPMLLLFGVITLWGVLNVFGGMGGGSSLGLFNLFLPIIIVVIIILTMVTTMWGFIAMLALIGSDQRIGVFEAYKITKKNLWGYLFVALLTGLAIMGGMIMLIVPGVIVSILLTFTMYTYLFEGQKGIDALIRSRQYVIGKWWRIVGYMVFIWIVNVIIQLPLGLVAEFAYDPYSQAISFIALSILSGLVSWFLSIITIAYLYHTYRHFRGMPISPKAGDPIKARRKYQILAWVGVLFPIFMIILAVSLASLDSARDLYYEEQYPAMENMKMPNI